MNIYIVMLLIFLAVIGVLLWTSSVSCSNSASEVGALSFQYSPIEGCMLEMSPGVFVPYGDFLIRK